MTDKTRKKLQDFARKYRLRHDWHEPDEQDVTARVLGKTLDNAMGDTGDCNEMVVVLYVDKKERCRVNLATVLSLAAEMRPEDIKDDVELTKRERENFKLFCRNATDRQLEEIIGIESEKDSEYHEWCAEAARTEQERRCGRGPFGTAMIKCQACKQEQDKTQTWWVCNCCGFRVCCGCVHSHTGPYGSGQKCSQCSTGQMELKVGLS